MNDDVEQVACPVCGKIIEVVLCWQEADYSVGIFGGWTGGIAIEDTMCFQHLTWQQREDVVDSAIIQREMRDQDDAEAAMEAEIERINND
jgi:hypothetical protein